MDVQLVTADIDEDTWRRTGWRRLGQQPFRPSNKGAHEEIDDQNKDSD